MYGARIYTNTNSRSSQSSSLISRINGKKDHKVEQDKNVNINTNFLKCIILATITTKEENLL